MATALAVGLPAAVAAVLYAATMAPDVHWSDSAELQRVVVTLELTHPPGYPLYTLGGRAWLSLLPMVDAARASNWLSGVAAVVAVALAALVAWRLTEKRAAALLTGLALAVAPSFWSQAIVAEVYALHCMLTAALLVALLRRKPSLPVVALLTGLSLSHHRMALLLLPGTVVALAMLVDREQLSRRRLGTSFACLVAGLSPLALTWWRGDWTSVRAFLAYVSHRGEAWLSLADPFGQLTEVVTPQAFQLLGIVGVVLTVLGTVWGARQSDRLLRAGATSLGLSWLFAFVFLFAYRVPDAYAFASHAQVLQAPLIGLGVVAALEGVGRRRPKGRVRWLPTLLAGLVMLFLTARATETLARVRHSDEYWTYPRRRSTEVLESTGRRAVLLTDWLLGQTMRYLQAVDGLRQDVKIVVLPEREPEPAIDALSGDRPVYLWGTGWEEELEQYDQLELVRVEHSEHRDGLYRLTEADPLAGRTWRSLDVAEDGGGGLALRSAAVRPWPVEADNLAELRWCWDDAAREAVAAGQLQLVLDPQNGWLRHTVVDPVPAQEEGCMRHLLVLPSPPMASRIDASLEFAAAGGEEVSLLGPQQWPILPAVASTGDAEGWNDRGPAAKQLFGDAQLGSVGYEPTRPGVGLALDVTWRLGAGADPAYELEWRLKDRSGAVVASTRAPLAPGFAAETLAPGVFVGSRVTVPVPRRASPGEYVLEIAEPRSGRAYAVGPVTVMDWERTWESPDLARSTDVELAGGAIELDGYELTLDPGLEVTLAWHCRESIEGDWKVFVHLASPDGDVVAQADGVPGDWLRWTDGWVPGEYVIDRHRLALPPDLDTGGYRLLVGMYDPETGARVPVAVPESAESLGGQVSLQADAIVIPVPEVP